MNIKMRPLGRIEKALDKLLKPLMYVLAGTVWESPQQTHVWNNDELSYSAVADLIPRWTETVNGSPTARKRRYGVIPVFHAPIFGGWRDYVVLEPQMDRGLWHLGWITEDVIGVSRIALMGRVRALRGPSTTQFFGVNPEGEQIPIYKVAIGRIGAGGPHAQLPLL